MWWCPSAGCGAHGWGSLEPDEWCFVLRQPRPYRSGAALVCRSPWNMGFFRASHEFPRISEGTPMLNWHWATGCGGLGRQSTFQHGTSLASGKNAGSWQKMRSCAIKNYHWHVWKLCTPWYATWMAFLIGIVMIKNNNSWDQVHWPTLGGCEC